MDASPPAINSVWNSASLRMGALSRRDKKRQGSRDTGDDRRWTKEDFETRTPSKLVQPQKPQGVWRYISKIPRTGNQPTPKGAWAGKPCLGESWLEHVHAFEDATLEDLYQACLEHERSEIWIPIFSSCATCEGFIFDQEKSDVCRQLGVCGCVVAFEHELDLVNSAPKNSQGEQVDSAIVVAKLALKPLDFIALVAMMPKGEKIATQMAKESLCDSLVAGRRQRQLERMHQKQELESLGSTGKTFAMGSQKHTRAIAGSRHCHKRAAVRRIPAVRAR